MTSVVLFLGGLILMTLESVLLGVVPVHGWALQTPLMVAILVGLDRDFVPGALVMLALFVPVEWFVGGIYGLYSLGLAAVFLAMQLLRGMLQPQWGVARGVVGGIGALVHGVVLWGVLFLMGQSGGTVAQSVLWYFWLATPVVAVGTVLLGKGFARLETMMDPERRASGLSF